MKSIFITVRTGSTRLPYKSMIDLHGRPSVEWLIMNLKKSKEADKIVLCTTCEVCDDVLCNLASKNNIDYFRGSTEDKLLRWLGACEKYNVEFFVNVDGDDLFFDYELADHVFKQYDISKPDFIDGQGVLYNDVYGMTKKTLKYICDSKGDSTAEYIKPHIEDGVLFTDKIKYYDDKWIKGDVRMTLDYKEDHEFFETVLRGLGSSEVTFDNIMEFINNNPHVKNINWSMEEEWKRRQNSQIKKESGSI